MHLSEIYTYPLKSACGVGQDQAELRPRGLLGDRRWMLVDPQGRFVTGRVLPQLVRLRAEWRTDALVLRWIDGRQHVEPVPATSTSRIEVRVWDDQLSAVPGSAAAQVWLSELFGRELRLAYMDQRSERRPPVRADCGPQQVSFADAYPLMMCTEASRAALEQAVGRPLVMARFRPNLVLTGSQAWAEDQWQVLQIGALRFRVASACTRCVFTTVDPESAEREADGEPLSTLRRLRQRPDGVIFGINLLPLDLPSGLQSGLARLQRGDPVVRLE